MLINYKKKQRLQDFNFFIGDHLIEQCTSYKYLGVIIDNKLKVPRKMVLRGCKQA